MNWIKVNDKDETTLPTLEKVVHVIYLGDDDGQLLALGARTDGGGGWLWAINHYHDYARDSEFSDLETDDDYRVIHWAEIEWPED